MASNLDGDPLPKRICSSNENAAEVFCPHCKTIVSRSTYYRHQVLNFNEQTEPLQEPAQSIAESEADQTFAFEDGENLATGKYQHAA